MLILSLKNKRPINIKTIGRKKENGPKYALIKLLIYANEGPLAINDKKINIPVRIAPNPKIVYMVFFFSLSLNLNFFFVRSALCHTRPL